MILEGKLADGLVESVGRPFQKNSGQVWTWADELSVQTDEALQID